MVTTVGSVEAGRDLSLLLERVQLGERFVITLRGTPVAELAPVPKEPSCPPIEQIIRELRELRSRTFPTTPAEIKQWINEGRP